MEQAIRLMKLQAEMMNNAKTQEEKMQILAVFTKRIQKLQERPQEQAA